MRVVLDSNIIVAAFATHGLCYDIFEYCLKNTNIMCSDYIAQEVKKVLLNKIKTPSKSVAEIIKFLKDQTEWISPEEGELKNLRDPKDYMVFATALKGKADYLITGDKDLLDLKEVKGIVIISPRNFWVLSQNK